MKRLALFLTMIAFSLRAANTNALTLVKTIPLPGVKGRLDHFAIDPKGHRLLVAALGNNTLEVIDISAGTHLKSIPGMRKPQGVLYLEEQNQIAAANGEDGTLKFFDGPSYKLLGSIGSMDDADNVRFDAKTKLIYVGFGDGSLASIDPKTMKQTGRIKLAAHPESFQLEQQGSRIFI